MTCAEAAAEFETAVAIRKAKSHAPVALRYRQMERLAVRLREHADEDRFTNDLRGTLGACHALQLLMLEVAFNSWWGWPAEVTEVTP